jgi:hypothetical protein
MDIKQAYLRVIRWPKAVSKFSHLPVVPVRNKDGHWVMVRLAFGRTCMPRCGGVMWGRIPLYLMDTDIDENEEQKGCNSFLYVANWDNRFKQKLC